MHQFMFNNGNGTLIDKQTGLTLDFVTASYFVIREKEMQWLFILYPMLAMIVFAILKKLIQLLIPYYTYYI